jgi:hypothetical protein
MLTIRAAAFSKRGVGCAAIHFVGREGRKEGFFKLRGQFQAFKIGQTFGDATHIYSDYMGFCLFLVRSNGLYFRSIINNELIFM